MRNHLFLVPAILFFSLLASANPTEGHACLKLREACSKAGFMPGAAKSNKGLVKNCIEVLIKGGSVPGVVVAAEVVTACKDKMESRKKK